MSVAVSCVGSRSAGWAPPVDTKTTAPSSAPTSATTPPLKTAATAAELTFREHCAAASAYSRKHQGDFVLVLRDGEVLFAEGRGDWSATSQHLLASGTKSFCGIAAAIAVDDGLLTFDERVSDTIDEWKADPAKARVTVRQLLSLASGLESLSEKIETARAAESSGIRDRAKTSINARLLAKPGERFIYGPSSFYVFGELMKRKLVAARTGDRDIVDFLERKVFKPLGITPQFQRDLVGNPNMAGGGRIGAAEWARFGEMVHAGGIIEKDGVETRIVSTASLKEILRSHGPNPRYGLAWWLLNSGDGNAEDEIAADRAGDRLKPSPTDGPVRRAIRQRIADRVKARDAGSTNAEERKTATPEDGVGTKTGASTRGAPLGVMAAGKGKQRLYLLPEANLVVVRFGNVDGGKGYSDTEFLRLLLEPVEKGKPKEQTTEKPTDEATDKATDKATETATDKATDKSPVPSSPPASAPAPK